MSNTLWTTPQQTSGKIIRSVAALGGVPVEVAAGYEHYVDNKKPEFLSKFPHGKIPAFESADGFKLFEGVAIARYVASQAPNGALLGANAKDAALIDQWIHLADTEVDIFTTSVYLLVNGIIQPYNKPIHTAYAERQLRALKTLDAHLASRTFFVGERITLADVYIAGIVFRAVAVTLGASERTQVPNLVRHLETVVNQPQVKDIFGTINYAEKAAQYVPPAKEKKEPKPAAAPAPKAEKKPKKEEEDEEEADVPAEPKAKNPLDDLPKSTFNLEDWKRQYSNNETRGAGGSIEWFYKNFDKDGFSVWRVDFKYNEELTLTFMSANQITGFYNRLEASRKYLFASSGVLGESNNSVISGVMILRGPDAKPVVEVAPDWESYSYKKLDLENADDKSFFEAALAWDLELDGKKWVDGKLIRLLHFCEYTLTLHSVPLFLGCRKYLLRSLYSDLRTLSSSSSSSTTSPPVTPGLPQPVTRKTTTDDARSSALHSTVARSIFSLMFTESSMMFIVLMLQGLDLCSPRTRHLSWMFSLTFLLSAILILIPFSFSLLVALGPGPSHSHPRPLLLYPRIIVSLVPVILFLFVISRIPLPSSIASASPPPSSFTTALARLVVVGTVILGLLSGFGAVNHTWTYLPSSLKTQIGDPTETDVSTAEYSLQNVRDDLRERRAIVEQRAAAQSADGSGSGGSTSWLSRVTPSFRGTDDGLTAELRGLEALEYHMDLNVSALRARRQAALYRRTMRGRILYFGGALFAGYCVARILGSLYNVLPLPWRSQSQTTQAQSQSDLIATLLARALALTSTHPPSSTTIASVAHQLSLVFVGAIILTSVRRVLGGVTRALRVTSRNLGASFMMLVLAQLMGIYLLSTIVQLRNSFPPPLATGELPDVDAHASLFTSIPEFEVFAPGSVFDWAVLVAAAGTAMGRWGGEKVGVVGGEG
ncbi:hypothetical protein H0H92_014119 [Tricholoma furcatifolium]|nr:hypothetical protein H0H92_014119 [Tricholoma furcatifolium]